MSLFSWFKKKRDSGAAAFDKMPENQKEAYEHSLEVRRNEAELRRLRHQVKVEEQRLQIADLRAQLDEYRPDDDNENASTGGLSPENMLMTIIANALTSPKAPGASAEFSQNPPILTDERSGGAPGAELTDEQIKEIINKLPKNQVKIARSMPDPIIKDYLKKNFPYDDSTINRAILILKEKL
jgi:hypothetical protein